MGLLNYFIILFFVVITDISISQILTSELDTMSGEEIANRTYMAELTSLQSFLFDKYNRKIRPVKNQSYPIRIQVHVYIMHYSVNQIEQTITINGHIYMTWDDEMAVWDPIQFNNIRSTMAKQWDIWQPDLKIANSVSGVNQYFEISKRSHVTLTHISLLKTKVEVYPTFSVRIGCNFDYSDYPFDEQHCAMRLYTTQVMSEVELLIYYDMHPSIMLAWGEQSEKRHISDWELLSAFSNLSYYKNRKYVNERPTNMWETQNTWTLLLVWINLRRNTSLFWVGLALPTFVSTILNIGSFWIIKPEYSILVVFVNFFIQSVFLHDVTKRELPPVVGNLPRIVLYLNALLIMTMIALALHFISIKLFEQKYKKMPRLLQSFWPILKYITPSPNQSNLINTPLTSDNIVVKDHKNLPSTSAQLKNTDFMTIVINSKNSNHLIDGKTAVFMFRNCFAILYTFVSICLLLIFWF